MRLSSCNGLQGKARIMPNEKSARPAWTCIVKGATDEPVVKRIDAAAALCTECSRRLFLFRQFPQFAGRKARLASKTRSHVIAALSCLSTAPASCDALTLASAAASETDWAPLQHGALDLRAGESHEQRCASGDQLRARDLIGSLENCPVEGSSTASVVASMLAPSSTPRAALERTSIATPGATSVRSRMWEPCEMSAVPVTLESSVVSPLPSPTRSTFSGSSMTVLAG